MIGLEYAKSQGLELFSFQRDGVDLMKEMIWARRRENSDGRAGVLLFDEMGLGKTMEAIAFLAELDPQPKRVLVICPNTLKREWENAIKRWLPTSSNGGSPEVATYATGRGGLRRFYALLENEAWLAAKTRIMITNYETLRSKQYAEILAAFSPELIIWDEAHRLRNWEKKTAAAARKMTAPTELLLTGTPIVNHAGDLWSLVSRVSPKIAGSPQEWEWNFTHQYATRGGIKKVGVKNSVLLKSLLEKVAIQRKKEEVLKDLPPKLYREVPLDMEGGQREVYEAMERQLFILLDEEGNTLQATCILAQLTRLRQLCCDPRIVGVTESSPISPHVTFEPGLVPYDPDYRTGVVELLDQSGQVMKETKGVGGIKTEFLLELIEDLGSAQLVVFSNFEKYISLIEDLLKGKGFSIGRLTGKEKGETRGNNIDKFTAGEFQILLGTTQAGGEGVNLQVAQKVVLLDRWWSPVRNEQAIDRLHRIGQRGTVDVILPHCVETIDDALKEILAKKLSIINELRIQGDTVEVLRQWRERRLGVVL